MIFYKDSRTLTNQDFKKANITSQVIQAKWPFFSLSYKICMIFRQLLPSLKLRFSHLKMDGWKTSFLLGWPVIRGELLVLGSVIKLKMKFFIAKQWINFRVHHLFWLDFIHISYIFIYHISWGLPKPSDRGKIILTMLLRDLYWPSLSTFTVFKQDPTYIISDMYINTVHDMIWHDTTVNILEMFMMIGCNCF